MNAVVLTAVLSCLNSGLYTASRMLFVLAARREAPMQLITVNSRGVPVWAILSSTVIGFLSVIAAYVSPDTVFLFLLNSSGAVILFVYLLISVSEFILRRHTPDDQLVVKMWLFPVLTVVAAVGIVAILVQMGLDSATRSQLWLSLLSWGLVLVLYAVTRWRGGSVSPEETRAATRAGRVLVLANRTMLADELNQALHDVEGSQQAEYRVVVPANPVDTGQAEKEGAAFVWEATEQAARDRLDQMLRGLREQGLTVDGQLGDYRPLVALEAAAREFHPDRIVISTQAEDRSTWLRHGVVEEARRRYDVPVQHVVAHEAAVH
jgi:GABA permease